MYEKYFLEIVSAIQKKMLIGADIMFIWAAANAPELYAQECALYEELNSLWECRDTVHRVPTKEFEAFKAKVLAWGRVILQIYKKYAKVK